MAPPNQTHVGRPAHCNDAYAQRRVPTPYVPLHLCATGRQRWTASAGSGACQVSENTATSAHTDREAATDGVIVIDHLVKTFGSVRAVDDLSFTVRPGRVTGFLGPNGAGKTTTLRILLGLVAPTAGTATISGSTYLHVAQPMRAVGAALEAASFHPGRSALDHLRVYAPQVGVSDARCREVLDFVGLDTVAGRRAGAF